MMGIGRRMFWGKLRWFIRDPAFVEACRTVKDFAELYVQKAINAASLHENNENDENRYVFIKELAKNVSDPVFLRDNLLAVFTAGHESTAILLSNILFLTSRRPDVWKKLREEALEVEDETITFELLKSLRYLQHVINESESNYLYVLSEC